MAETTSSLLKRPHPQDDESNAQKRSRSNNGSHVPASNGATAAAKPDINKMLADARARAEALKARLQGGQGTATSAPSTSGTPPSSTAVDRIAQMRARVAAATG